jgi:RecA-family ATPase
LPHDISAGLDAALLYQGHGLAVFPLRPREKTPSTSHGVKDATLEGGKAHRWWTSRPDANVAVATGAVSGVVVLDVDGDEGLASLHELLREHGVNLPKTPCASTGKGMHLYFRHPGGSVGNRVGIRPGLDLRADGGYVVAPPSVHPSGDTYKWVVGLDTPFAKLPAYIETIAEPAVPHETDEGIVPEGRRNDAAFRDAAGMRRRGMSAPAILAALTADNGHRYAPPLEDEELRHIVASVMRYSPDGEVLKDEDWQTRQLERIAARRRPPTTSIIEMEDVETEAVSWLWPDYIPLGKITVLDGDPGLGKSTILFDLAARVSRGAPMPDGSFGTTYRQPAGVIVYSVEDGLGDTVRPRLEAARADLARIAALGSIFDEVKGELVERPVTIPDDLAVVESTVLAKGARLLMLDPLMAMFSPGIDGNKDQDVRRALAPVKSLAERLDVAVVILRHMSKMGGRSALYRGGGSIGIIGAARAGIVVAKSPDDPERERVFSQSKSNLGKPADSLKYTIEQAENGVGRIVWAGKSTYSADDLVNQDVTDAPERREAMEFLRDLLTSNEVPAIEVKSLAKAAGITDATLRRAKADLKVQVIRRGFGKGSESRWYIPSEVSTYAEPTSAEAE